MLYFNGDSTKDTFLSSSTDNNNRINNDNLSYKYKISDINFKLAGKQGLMPEKINDIWMKENEKQLKSNILSTNTTYPGKQQLIKNKNGNDATTNIHGHESNFVAINKSSINTTNYYYYKGNSEENKLNGNSTTLVNCTYCLNNRHQNIEPCRHLLGKESVINKYDKKMNDVALNSNYEFESNEDTMLLDLSNKPATSKNHKTWKQHVVCKNNDKFTESVSNAPNKLNVVNNNDRLKQMGEFIVAKSNIASKVNKTPSYRQNPIYINQNESQPSSPINLCIRGKERSPRLLATNSTAIAFGDTKSVKNELDCMVERSTSTHGGVESVKMDFNTMLNENSLTLHEDDDKDNDNPQSMQSSSERSRLYTERIKAYFESINQYMLNIYLSTMTACGNLNNPTIAISNATMIHNYEIMCQQQNLFYQLWRKNGCIQSAPIKYQANYPYWNEYQNFSALQSDQTNIFQTLDLTQHLSNKTSKCSNENLQLLKNFETKLDNSNHMPKIETSKEVISSSACQRQQNRCNPSHKSNLNSSEHNQSKSDAINLQNSNFMYKPLTIHHKFLKDSDHILPIERESSSTSTSVKSKCRNSSSGFRDEECGLISQSSPDEKNGLSPKDGLNTDSGVDLNFEDEMTNAAQINQNYSKNIQTNAAIYGLDLSKHAFPTPYIPNESSNLRGHNQKQSNDVSFADCGNPRFFTEKSVIEYGNTKDVEKSPGSINNLANTQTTYGQWLKHIGLWKQQMAFSKEWYNNAHIEELVKKYIEYQIGLRTSQFKKPDPNYNELVQNESNIGQCNRHPDTTIYNPMPSCYNQETLFPTFFTGFQHDTNMDASFNLANKQNNATTIDEMVREEMNTNNDTNNDNNTYNFDNEISMDDTITNDESKMSVGSLMDTMDKDNRLALALSLPFSLDDIVSLPIDAFGELLRKSDLTAEQIGLVRDIRRRGKNKIAAQNCRKRKLDMINYLGQNVNLLNKAKARLLEERLELEHQINEYRQKLEQSFAENFFPNSINHTIKPFDINISNYEIDFGEKGCGYLRPRDLTDANMHDEVADKCDDCFDEQMPASTTKHVATRKINDSNDLTTFKFYWEPIKDMSRIEN